MTYEHVMLGEEIKRQLQELLESLTTKKAIG